MADVFTFDQLAKSIEAGYGGEAQPLNQSLDDALVEVVKAVARSNAKGSITLALKIEPSGKGQVVIKANITTKRPAPGAMPLALFVDRRGRLLAEDPDQGRLPLENISGGGKPS